MSITGNNLNCFIPPLTALVVVVVVGGVSDGYSLLEDGTTAAFQMLLVLFLQYSASPSTESSHLTLLCSLQKAVYTTVSWAEAEGAFFWKRWRPWPSVILLGLPLRPTTTVLVVLEGILRPALTEAAAAAAKPCWMASLYYTKVLVTLQLQIWSRITKIQSWWKMEFTIW